MLQKYTINGDNLVIRLMLVVLFVIKFAMEYKIMCACGVVDLNIIRVMVKEFNVILDLLETTYFNQQKLNVTLLILQQMPLNPLIELKKQ